MPEPSLLLDQSFPNLAGIPFDYPPLTPDDDDDNCGGKVATADLVSEEGQGLRVSIIAASGWSGNTWRIRVVENSDAPGTASVAVDDDERLVTVTYDSTGLTASLLSAVKAAVDAEDELTSAYFGREDGTTRLTGVTASDLVDHDTGTIAFSGGDNGRCIGILSDADGDLVARLAGSDNVGREVSVRAGEIRPGRFLRVLSTGTDAGLNLVAVTT